MLMSKHQKHTKKWKIFQERNRYQTMKHKQFKLDTPKWDYGILIKTQEIKIK